MADTFEGRISTDSAGPGDDLARASTLPSRYYLDPAILELEKERIFGAT